MTPTWLIEADVFGTSMEPLKRAIRSQGLASQIVRLQSLQRGLLPVVGGRPVADGDCIVLSCTYPLFRHVELHHNWIPGGWCTIENFDCERYYEHFGARLLNAEHAILSLDDALAQADSLFERFAERGQVFMRPTGLEKTFTGRPVDRDAFARALESARYKRDVRVVVASPQTIEREWRLVVAGDQVLSGSQYLAYGELDIKPDCPYDVSSFAKELLASTEWRPDPIFMLDVCESAGAMHLLELNSFSCSGLYECDPAPIVETVSKLAGEEWQTAQG